MDLAAVDLATVDLAAVNLAAVAANISGNLSPADVPTLRTALFSENGLTRLYAADALWTLTADADLDLPTLVSAANSDNAETRDLELAAITQLGRASMPAIPILDDMASQTAMIEPG